MLEGCSSCFTDSPFQADSSLFVEVDYAQLSKRGQNICGDAFNTSKIESENRVVSVLSDGLGSGVKANILASMTARMALKFTSANRDILKSCDVIMDSLPICRVRRISYATFTIVDSVLHGRTRVVEQGNPDYLLIRDGAVVRVERRVVTTRRWRDRELRLSEIDILPGDRLVLVSDGVTQAGLGSDDLKLGWRIAGCAAFLISRINEDPEISARTLSRDVVRQAALTEPEGQATDDISCGVLYFRKPRTMLLVSGPPYDQTRDGEVAFRIDTFSGRTAVCGGTTANILSRELNREVSTNLGRPRGDLPPVSVMDGIDLVTEGILTLTRAVRYLRERHAEFPADGAGRLCSLMMDSDWIEFMVGTRINDAHQDPTLPVELEFRRNIIRKIAGILEKDYFKRVSISYI
ncbi:MAG: serine/threonine protein phosphatase [Candidatus Wallbacteria bacterium HGW-Wallbacteria-1]|jgi:hypothetical protein|uniref:Serine/threonine protein phosphatase n=1 Tax=Candidatus Wallbacteria bacterium HGW-Wallbacteria-1 TaxID=2013854 RepID=A0A2N1PNC5_9BACT|nr:MAG: serine/threonine protein phosphatase [Candidatus Wallbacteria bacterium HGW-Wallbacteria-1]